MPNLESEEIEDPKPWIISNAGRIMGVIIAFMSILKLGQSELLNFLKICDNEAVYWILVFGMILEMAAITRLYHIIIRINRRFGSLPPTQSLLTKALDEIEMENLNGKEKSSEVEEGQPTLMEIGMERDNTNHQMDQPGTNLDSVEVENFNANVKTQNIEKG